MISNINFTNLRLSSVNPPDVDYNVAVNVTQDKPQVIAVIYNID